jgi:hypothetical protein
MVLLLVWAVGVVLVLVVKAAAVVVVAVDLH